MASTYKPETPSRSEKQSPAGGNCSAVDVTLRVLLFAASLSAVVVMVTSKETKLVALAVPPFSIRVPSKFTYSPAFIYFVVALSIAVVYSFITTLVSLSVMAKRVSPKLYLLLLAFWDVVMLGLVGSATGASTAVAYIGLKGNKHTGWSEICSVYGKYCRHIGSASAVALVASILLILLSVLSIYSLYKRVRD
ncbi:CASP-like protein 1D1 [Pistacia vera]|uniref:CASP-like protein 1D1 n=1 Tax=Pistacia vera TaxID=55513 RepID=UPI0012631CBE|nr:CASP-like protein 1D1 [Pistacia vera]